MTSVNVDNLTQSKIHKVVPQDVKYDPIAQKKLFNNVAEMFRWIFIPTTPRFEEPSLVLQPNHVKKLVV